VKSKYETHIIKECKEMPVDFRKVKTIILSIAIGGDIFTRVKSFKLLSVWIDNGLKWNTNTAYIIKKAVKRLHLLKVLKSYNAPIHGRPKSLLYGCN
jgi:hypothetical protein